MRWATPRPQSNSSFCFPASTRILGPNRSIIGAGEPVPKRVTFRSWAGADPAKAAVGSNSKTPAHQRCLLGARFIRQSSPLSFQRVYTLQEPTPDNCGYRAQLTPISSAMRLYYRQPAHVATQVFAAPWTRRFSMNRRQKGGYPKRDSGKP